MRKKRQAQRAAVLCAFLAMMGASAANAAELGVLRPAANGPIRLGNGCWLRWACGPVDCDWRRFCPARCPDRYSCFSLYGAYHPYGGVGYWGAYTYSGWR